MVSLAEVKRDIDLWKEPLEAELQALVQSGTIRRARADQVPQESGYDYMTVAPAQDGSNHQITCCEKNIRIVLCGNLVRPADHAKPVDAGVQAMVIYDRELMKELEVQRLQIAWNVVPGGAP